MAVGAQAALVCQLRLSCKCGMLKLSHTSLARAEHTRAPCHGWAHGVAGRAPAGAVCRLALPHA